MGPYRFLCVLMDSNWFLWNTVGPYASLWFLMGLYMSLCVLMDFKVSLCVLIGLYSFLWILMGLNVSLYVYIRPYGNYWSL